MIFGANMRNSGRSHVLKWFWLLTLLCGGILSAAELESTDPYSRDVVMLTSWFGGEWDNDEQLWFESGRRANWPKERRHQRVHTLHRRADLPWLGKHVFYIEEYVDNDPAKVIRQRLVTFASDQQAGGVRSEIHFFRKPEQWLGAYASPGKLSTLKREDIYTQKGCHVLWKQEGEQYRGVIAQRECVLGEGAQQRWAQFEALLGKDKYWRVDRTLRLSDNSLHTGHIDEDPFRLRRAARFNCDVNFLVDYLKGPDPADQHEVGLSIHAQGGEIRVVRKSTGVPYVLRLRQREYAYYTTDSDFMYLNFREEGKPFSAYSLHDPDARFLGMNLNWMSVACRRVTEP